MDEPEGSKVVNSVFADSRHERDGPWYDPTDHQLIQLSVVTIIEVG